MIRKGYIVMKKFSLLFLVFSCFAVSLEAAETLYDKPESWIYEDIKKNLLQ